MITNDNLFTNSYNAVKSFLNGIANLDPRKRFKGNYIHASMPNINQKGFDGYPFVVLKVEVSEANKSLDGSVSEKTFRTMIAIYSDDPVQVDSMSDLVFSNLKSQLTEFQVKELSNSSLSWNMDEHGKKISFRNIGVIGKCRI